MQIEVNKTSKPDEVETCLKCEKFLSEKDFPRYLFIPIWISTLDKVAKRKENVITNPTIPTTSVLVKFDTMIKKRKDNTAGTRSTNKRTKIFLGIVLNSLWFKINT